MWVLGGGRTAPNPSTEVDIYDASLGTWSTGLPFTGPRRNFPADSDGARVFLVGGYDNTGIGVPVNTMQIFTPATGCPTPTPTATPTATASPTATATASPTATASATVTPPPPTPTITPSTPTPTPTSTVCCPATPTPTCVPNSQVFAATLTGGQEVPPTGSTATGSGIVVLDQAQTTITVNLNFTGLAANATMAHIHAPGAPGVSAPIIIPLTGFPAATSGTYSNSFAITPTQVSQLQNGLCYLNIHNATFPNGEIRGQLALFPCPPLATPTPTATATPPSLQRHRHSAYRHTYRAAYSNAECIALADTTGDAGHQPVDPDAGSDR